MNDHKSVGLRDIPVNISQISAGNVNIARMLWLRYFEGGNSPPIAFSQLPQHIKRLEAIVSDLQYKKCKFDLFMSEDCQPYLTLMLVYEDSAAPGESKDFYYSRPLGWDDSPAEVAKQALFGILYSVQHEVMEFFQYCGEIYFDPHRYPALDEATHNSLLARNFLGERK